MRRNDKEITDVSALAAVIQKSLVCRLGLSDGLRPYVVPLCFGYQDGCLYFHSALNGNKIEMIRKNSNVCFEFDINAEVVEHQLACNWSMRYQSVIGFGKAVIIEDVEEKVTALDTIMKQYSGKSFSFPAEPVKLTTVFKVVIESMTGKQSGHL